MFRLGRQYEQIFFTRQPEYLEKKGRSMKCIQLCCDFFTAVIE